jgi:hypothetical protein
MLRRSYEVGDVDFVALRLEVIEMLCLWELYVPASEHLLQLHLLLHVVSAMERWGSGRNFWMFSFER